MGGGGSPAAPSPVAVPSAADEEAAAERARLYSLLRSRRAGRGLAYGPMKRQSLLQPAKAAATPASALATVPTWYPGDGGTGEGDSDSGPSGGNSADSPSSAGDGRW